MAVTLKEISKRKNPFPEGTRHAALRRPIVLRQVMLAAEQPIVVGCATGCMEVSTTIYPTPRGECLTSTTPSRTSRPR